MPFKNQHFARQGALRSIKARKLVEGVPRHHSPANGLRSSSENKNAGSPADHYSGFPASHPYRGHRAEIRYRAGVPVRLEGGAHKVHVRRDASTRPTSNGMDTI